MRRSKNHLLLVRPPSMQTKWIKLDLGPAGFVLMSRSIPKLLRLWLITSSVRFRTLFNGGLTVCTITPAIPNNYSLYFSSSFVDLISYWEHFTFLGWVNSIVNTENIQYINQEDLHQKLQSHHQLQLMISQLYLLSWCNVIQDLTLMLRWAGTATADLMYPLSYYFSQSST